MIKSLILQIITIILAATPLSLIIINFFSKHDPKLGHATTLCLGVKEILIKPYISVKTILFDKYRLSIKDSNMVEMLNKESNEKIAVDIRHLKKDDTINLIATIIHLLNFSKTKQIEKTISDFFEKCQINKKNTEQEYKLISKLPTNKDKKFSTLVTQKKESKEVFAFSKGNPKKLLERCKRIIINGNKIDLTNQHKRKIKKRIDNLNKKGQKAIAFAYKGLPQKILNNYSEEFTENDLIFVGIVAISNHLNREAIPQVKNTKKMGLKTYILTEIKERNALAISKELKLINPQYFETITGAYLKRISNKKLKKMLSNKDKDYLFAELKKEDKERIKEKLEESGEIVVEANKENNKNIQSILNTIKKSRIVNQNNKKILFHALSFKTATLILVLFALILRVPSPLTISLILILDIFVNTFLESILRDEKPLKKNTNISKKRIFLFGLFTSVILIAVFVWNLLRLGWSPGESFKYSDSIAQISSSLIFILLILIQIFVAFAVRRINKPLIKSKPLKSPYLIFISSLIIIIGFIFIYFDPFISYLNLSPLSSTELYLILLIMAVIIVLTEIKKLLFKK